MEYYSSMNKHIKKTFNKYLDSYKLSINNLLVGTISSIVKFNNGLTTKSRIWVIAESLRSKIILL